MMEIPQKIKSDNKISFAIRTRIKVFFRPVALKGDHTALMKNIKWTLSKKEGQWIIEGDNPTPYHMSFFSLQPGISSEFQKSADGGMIAPFSKAEFNLGPVENEKSVFNRLKVEFINDFGGSNTMEFNL
jgi:chaperone protein EcpD